jgi:outer membrane usher protein
LNISVPQIYEDQRLKNYVSPEFWDKGITALNLGWMANAWNSHTSSANGRITAAPIWASTPACRGTAGC